MSQSDQRIQSDTLIPLADELQESDSVPLDDGVCAENGIIGWPCAWQRPAATEEAAWKSVTSCRPMQQGCCYFGFPWATLIDGLQRNMPIGWKLLRKLEQIRKEVLCTFKAVRTATVCQHIRAAEFTELFRRAGVTDIFWPHTIKNQQELDGMRIHGFPLYPAQVGDKRPQLNSKRPRKWLANFIGAYNPQIYLSDVRARIFEDKAKPDFLIKKREAWHFDRAVYEEQINGMAASEALLAIERLHKQEYIDAIRDSVFTLCPTGSGPNSIRIYESLALGSIPVILTCDLALPGDIALWQSACVFEEDSVEGYNRAIARIHAMPESEIRRRQATILKLFNEVAPDRYSDLIRNSLL